jgi:hypothetical protein
MRVGMPYFENKSFTTLEAIFDTLLPATPAPLITLPDVGFPLENEGGKKFPKINNATD